MKKVIWLLIPFFTFIACDNDDDGYSLDKFWIDIVTVENDDKDGYFFMTRDDGVRLWTVATNYPNYRPSTGQRIIANYTILNDKPTGSGYNHDVKLNNAYDVLTKEIEELTPANDELFGNDLLGIYDLWIGGDYLNIRFYYGGYNKTHRISLVWDESTVHPDGKIHLELRHNANDDASSYRYNGLVSFNLESLTDEVTENISSLNLVIHVKEYDNENKEYPITYNFTNNNRKELNEDIFDNTKENNIQ